MSEPLLTGYVKESSLPVRERWQRDRFMGAVWEAGYQQFERIDSTPDDPECVALIWRFTKSEGKTEDTIRALQSASDFVTLAGEKLRQSKLITRH